MRLPLLFRRGSKMSIKQVPQIFMICFFLNACSTEEATETTSCIDYIEDSQWDEAITCYEDGDYDDSPAADLPANDYIYLASWAGAYASKHGVSGIDILESVANSSSSGDSESAFDPSAVTTSLSVGGTLSQAVIDLQRSVDLIMAIPAEFRTTGSATAGYYAADVETIGSAYIVFLADFQQREFSDNLESGELTDAELLEQADALIETLQNSGDLITDPTIQAQVDAQLEELNNQPGADNREKLESLLNNS